MDPSNVASIQHIGEPKLASKLCQYLHAVAWISLSMPRFAERDVTLHRLLDQCYKKVRRRIKRAIAKMNLTTLGWDSTRTAAFNKLQEQL